MIICLMIPFRSQASHRMDSLASFKWRYFLPNIILLKVRYHSYYSRSYWDLEKMILERGVEVDHTMIDR
jgi:transposase-like protein